MAGMILPIVSGLAGLFGGLKGQQQYTNTNQQQNQSGEQFGNSRTTPELNPFQQQLAALFTGGARQMWDQDTNLSPYTSQGLQAIAGQGDANRRLISNILAQRGLSYSPAAATPLTMNALNTGNQQSQFLSQIPLLQRQLQQQSLQGLMQAFQVQPFGQSSDSYGTTRGSSNMTGFSNSNVPGNPIAGALSGFGAALPLAFPNLFGGQQKQLGAVSNAGVFDNMGIPSTIKY